MKLVGGRDPANRPPGPIWASAVVCAVAAVGFYYLTINTSDGIVEYVKDAFGNLGPTYAKSGLVSLTVGTRGGFIVRLCVFGDYISLNRRARNETVNLQRTGGVF